MMLQADDESLDSRRHVIYFRSQYHNNFYIVRRDHVDLPSSLGRPLDRCMSTKIAVWFSTCIDDIKVQVDLFIVFGVQVDVSIVLGIQVDRFIDYGV